MSDYSLDFENAVEQVLAEQVKENFNVDAHNYLVTTKTVGQDHVDREPSVGISSNTALGTVECILSDRATGQPKFKLEFEVSGIPNGEDDGDGWSSWLDDVDVELIEAVTL